MKNFLKQLNAMLAELGGLLMTIMMLLFLINIITREINKPIQGLLQLAVFAMVILIYLGLAHTEENDQHVRLEVITDRVSPRIKNKMRFVTHCIEWIIINICLLAVYRDALRAFIKKASVTGIVPMPLWPVKWIMVIGLIIYWLQLATCVIEDYKKIKSTDFIVDTPHELDHTNA
ncbi:TRAP transporter small permease [Aminobacterium sp. MB27-C1]|uniref:TRAP transporter small permease subunit n=1 Tax=unclassified Aminobacterium TaxID=2685012 RepID=UPI001BCE0DD2|nr:MULTISPECIES: TRAP transporter small permease [unclassified Aminobacterium]MEA4877658.1 TRAP transporter small permease [Aminobacterium sp.]WMI70779.1 TRAP transporter small permease [Aminobacterium sp. MB27-C1]